MTFAEMMKSIPTTVKGIKESLNLTTIDDVTVTAVEKDDRLIRPVRNNKLYMKRFMETARLIEAVTNGRKDIYFLKEAMTTADFPLLFGDVLYRQLLGNYTIWPTTYKSWMRLIKVRDFRTINMYMLDGGKAILEKVAERAPYKEATLTESRYQASVAKYGRRMSFSFEMFINDDLGAFQRYPRVMAAAVGQSEEYLAYQQLAGVNGPNTTMFPTNDSNKNIITGNPRLTVQALQTAFAKLAAQKDSDNNPIMIQAVTLVVPPALEITAQNIINALQIRINSSSNQNAAGGAQGGATIDQFLYAENWMKRRVNLVVAPYLPIISSTANGDTSWYLLATTDESQRPFAVFANLIGYENPQLFVKSPNAMQIGGGLVDPLQGDFDTDSIDYKIRHIFGAAQCDPKMGAASNGTEVA